MTEILIDRNDSAEENTTPPPGVGLHLLQLVPELNNTQRHILQFTGFKRSIGRPPGRQIPHGVMDRIFGGKR